MYSHSTGSKKKRSHSAEPIVTGNLLDLRHIQKYVSPANFPSRGGFPRYAKHHENLTRLEMAIMVAFIVVVVISRFGFLPVHADDVVVSSDPQITTQSTTPDGTNGGDPAPVPPGDGASGSADGTETTVTTGDATAVLGAENIVNTNIGDVVPSGADATTTPDTAVVSDAAPSDPQNIVNDSENDARVENEGTTTATTGENAAGSAGNATIVSGDAVATASVLNLVNTNIFNSTGFIAFLSNLFGSFDSVDLRSLPVYTDDRADSNTCTIFGCGNMMSVNANITSSSTANIFNNIFVRAFSGGNTASTTGNGNGMIDTGDAFASANVVNVANTNIVDSNYMMLVFNNFGDWDGDFIFPSSEFFENKFLGSEGSVGGNIPITSASTTFDNANAADITTFSTTTAASGDNSAATGDGATTVLSGNSNSTTNVLNHVNNNVYGGSSMAVIFRVHGNWNGSVFSLPPGVAWSETENGIAFWSEEAGGAGFGMGAGGGSSDLAIADTTTSGATVATDAKNTNSATIKNNVEVYALTGENKVETEGGAATIKTGNAYAGTNVVNVVNTNLFGTNWILAIIDIFGDWTGNISFGQPDLWLGGWIKSANNPLAPHDNLEYHYTIANRGDTDATHVRLTTHVDERLVYLSDGGTWGSDGIYWDLGTIPAGGSVDVMYQGEVRGHVPFGTTAFSSSASVAAYEPDANPDDNHEEIGSFAVYNAPVQTGPAGIYYETMPKLQVVKTNSATTTVAAPGMVDYKLTIYNDSTGSSYNSVLVDTLKDENGNVVYEETWDLGEVLPHEEINVSYSIEYNASTTSGVYTNYAKVKAYGGHVNPEYASIADSPTAMSIITIDGIESDATNAANTPTVTAHVGGADDSGDASALAGMGGSGNAFGDDVDVKENSDSTARDFVPNVLVTTTGARTGRDKLPTVVELHPLALALPPSDTLADSLWGNQSAAAFSAVLGSPWLYAGLIVLFILIVLYERRREKV